MSTPPSRPTLGAAGGGPALGSVSRPLITVEQLVARLADPALAAGTLVADVRWVLGQPGAGRAAYEAGHIPGGIHLDLDDDLADPDGFGAPGRHPLPTVAAFGDRLRAWGVDDDTLVVGYDDVGGWVAARLWWMLDNLGHTLPGRGGAAVLDGGWNAWRDAGLPVSTDRAPAPRHGGARLTLADRWTNVIDREELRGRLGTLTLLDARAPARYRGETEPIDPVAGHIPTALSAPWDATLDSDGRFKPAGELRRVLESLGAAGGLRGSGTRADGGETTPTVVSCGSGTSAVQHIVAARLAGLPDPILYVGSYSDWSRSGLPVATGSEPGSASMARSAETPAVDSA
ncbi:MAG TPA: sulfurtransferase [Candidatus Limnocylindrales bacterium]|nr:sulfurtransferase [Candidatus Limnocylindrales bacterium]